MKINDLRNVDLENKGVTRFDLENKQLSLKISEKERSAALWLRLRDDEKPWSNEKLVDQGRKALCIFDRLRHG